jgi:RNA-directed DNA polymerase
VRYADAFVVLMRGTVNETFNRVKQVLGRMDLTLHEEKSRVLDAREESFDFLEFTFAARRISRREK